MRVIMLSTDATILKDGTRAAERMRAYGTLFESLTVIIAGRGERQERVLGTTRVLYPGGTTKALNFFRVLYYTRLVRADIVSAQDPLWTGLVALLSMKPRVHIQVHTDTFGMREPLARFVLSRAHSVRVVSRHVQTKIHRWTKAPISILPIYVDAHVFTDPKPEPTEYRGLKKKILVVSRLSPEKRVDRALSACALTEETELFIVGDGPLRSRLEALGQRLGISARVHFLGWRNDVAPYYQHADCTLVTSSYEGYGMVFIEAVLAGCPVVSSNVGIVADLPERAVTVVEGDQYQLAEAIEKTLATDTKAHARARSQELASHLPSFEAYLAEYKRLIETCGT